MANLTDDRPRQSQASGVETNGQPCDGVRVAGIDALIEGCDSALRPGCGAVFSLGAQARGRLVVVHEVASLRLTEAEAARIADAVRQAVLERHQLKVDAVALIKPESIPRKASGEVDKDACQVRFLDGSLNASLCGIEERAVAESDSYPEFAVSDPIAMSDPIADSARSGFRDPSGSDASGQDELESASVEHNGAEKDRAARVTVEAAAAAVQVAPAALMAQRPSVPLSSGDSSATAATVPPRRRRFRLRSLLCRRSDGTLIEDESPERVLLPYVIGRRCDAVAFHESNYDLSKTLPWLRAFNKAAQGHKATLFDLFVWALACTSHKRPGMNRFVSARRLYQRNKVTGSFAAKTKLELDAPVVNIKLDFPPGESFAACAERIEAAVFEHRNGPPSDLEWQVGLLLRLPRLLVRATLGCYRLLDWLNLLPRRFIETDPLFTSAFVANLGSLGLESAYHHLYACGTCSIFAVLGAPRKMLFVDLDGKPQVRDGLQVRWTVDTRIADGHYNAVCLRMVQAIVEDPAQFTQPGAADLKNGTA